MQTEKNSKPYQQKKTGKRIFTTILVLLVILISLAVFLPPAFISSEKGRQTILAKINSSIDGRADFAAVSMSWLKGVRIKGISFKDGTGQTSVEVKQIDARPHYASILMGILSFGKTVIDEPRVEVNLKAPQTGHAEIPLQAARPEEGKAITLPVSRIDLVVNNGSLKITDPRAETVEISQINSRIDLRPPGQQTDFDVNIVVAGDGKESKIHTDGRIVPQKRTGWGMEGTSGEFTVEVNDLDLESLESLFALAKLEVGAKGRVSASVKSGIKDGQIETLNGTIEGEGLDLTTSQLKGDRLKSNRLNFAVKLQAQRELINIDNLQLHCDWADVNAGGAVPTTFKTLAKLAEPDSQYNLKANFDFDLAALLLQMPATFELKEGTKITSGRLSGDVGTLTEAGRRKITGTANLVGLAGVVGERAVALSKPVMAKVEITSDKAGINFDKLEVSAPSAKIECTGTAELLKYSANADLAGLQTELGQFVDMGQYRLGGELVSEGTVSGDKDKITLTGSSAVKNLRLSSQQGLSAEEPMVDMNFSFAVEPVGNVLAIDFINANAGFGRAGIKDAVLPLNKEAVKLLTLPVSVRIDLDKLRPFMAVLALLPQELQLSGVVESNVSISAEKDIYRFVTEATKFENLKVGYPQKKPFEQEQILLAGDVRLNPAQKSIAVTKLQLTSPQIKILKGEVSQTVRGDRSELKGQVDCEYDWAAVGAAAGTFLPGGLEIEGQRRNIINFSSEYPVGRTDELLANLNTSSKLGFEKARYMGLNFGPTDVNIEVQKGVLKIAPFSTTVNNGQLSFAGEADFGRKPTLLRIPKPIQIAKDIQINEETTGRLLMYVNPVFANALDVSGVVNFDCESLAIPLAGAARNDTEVVGTISVGRLRLQTSDLLGQILSVINKSPRGQNITIHPTRFVLQKGLLRYDDMQMDVGENPVNFRGTIGLDKTLDMNVTLPFTLDLKPVKVNEASSADRMSLPLRGTIDKPELDIAKLLQQQLLQRGLRELFK